MLLVSYSKLSCSSWIEGEDTKAELFTFSGIQSWAGKGARLLRGGRNSPAQKQELMASCLPVQKGFDVFNALDLMENKTFLEKLKFGIGDGNLQYYLYNWKCPSMAPEKVSAVRRGPIPTPWGRGFAVTTPQHCSPAGVLAVPHTGMAESLCHFPCLCRVSLGKIPPHSSSKANFIPGLVQVQSFPLTNLFPLRKEAKHTGDRTGLQGDRCDTRGCDSRL